MPPLRRRRVGAPHPPCRCRRCETGGTGLWPVESREATGETPVPPRKPRGSTGPTLHQETANVHHPTPDVQPPSDDQTLAFVAVCRSLDIGCRVLSVAHSPFSVGREKKRRGTACRAPTRTAFQTADQTSHQPLRYGRLMSGSASGVPGHFRFFGSQVIFLPSRTATLARFIASTSGPA